MEKEQSDNQQAQKPKTTKAVTTAAHRETIQPKKPKKPLSRRVFASVVIAGALVASMAGAGGVVYLFGQNGGQVVNQQSVVMQEGELVADVAEKVGPSVVSIVTEETAQTFYGPTTQESAGSGIIISKNGYVVTNKHVVSATTKNVKIVAADGTVYSKVRFVGSDPGNDISFLKIEGVNDLAAATLGDSSTVKVGAKAIAIGNALGEYQNTVTTGIISGLGRPVTAADSTGTSTETLENLLQTDAAINPGNSGGPLVNLNGEIIGINTAVASDAEGIGFAIPINDVKGMIKTLLADGKVVKPYIGVRYVSLTAAVAKEYGLDVTKGAYIVGDNAIVSGSPAQKAGLREGDIITKVNDTTVDASHPFASLVAQHSVGEQVQITYLRDGKQSTVTVTLAARS